MASQQALVDAVSSLLVSEYSSFAAFTLVVYDWLINLDEEIHCFWDLREGRKLTAAAVIYGITRYPLIIANILVLQTAFPMSETLLAYSQKNARSCQVNYRIQTVASFLWSFSPGIFSAVRVYALDPDRKAIAIATFLLHFMPGLTVLVMNAADQMTELPSPFNCTVSQAPTSTGVAFGGQKGVLKGPTITRVMLYNGSTYFIVLTGMNILMMILTRIQDPSGPSLENVASIVINPYVDPSSNQMLAHSVAYVKRMTAVLIVHFLFDLRRSDRTARIPSSPSAIPSLNIVGDVPEDHDALPAFIASMGSRVDSTARRHLVDSSDANEDMALRRPRNGGVSFEEC
ncbi:hypothetical protein V8D89_008700 [Ganoderma adspersum]